MKIDTYGIELSSSRQYLETDRHNVELKARFFEIFDEKVLDTGERPPLSRTGLGSGNATDGELDIPSSEWYEVTTFAGKAAIRLSEQFIEELKKLYEILDKILENLSSMGVFDQSSCCCHLTRVYRIHILPRPVERLFRYEFVREETHTHYEKEQTNFTANGRVKTQDGKEIDFALKMDMGREFFKEDKYTYQENGQFTLIDPLVINYEGNAPVLSDTFFSFDLNNDGLNEELASLSKGSGFLSFDRNEDGIINNGSELFGPATGNGFQELLAYDLDHNLWIDENDEIFDDLTIWENDENGEMRLTKIKDAGIGAIYLASVETPFDLTDQNNNLLGQVQKTSVVLNEDGSTGTIQEIDWTV